MGRRGGFLTHMLREMERSSRRAASAARVRQRRAEGVRIRAYEREMVRQERTAERERLRAEKAAERARIAEEKEEARRRKEEAKEAQLEEWRMEYEDHVDHDRQLLEIGNNAPEVEDRTELFSALLEPNDFTFPAFEPPPAVPPDWTRYQQIQDTRNRELGEAAARFKPNVAGFRLVTGAGGTLAAGGVAIAAAVEPSVGLVVLATGAIAGAVGAASWSSSARHQRGQFVEEARRPVAVELETERRRAEASAAEESARRLADARARYQSALAVARREFAQAEEERIAALQDLLAGKQARMTEELEDMFPLDLPVPCFVQTAVRDSATVDLNVDVPEPSVLKPSEAKLLASGKVSYRDKLDRRMRDEYRRFVAGVAIRHASEVMLHLPTCNVVNVTCWRKMLDESKGTPTRARALDVAYDFATLAPMTMDSVDPVAALKHFRHTVESL